MTSTAPGWYTDPSGSGQNRYWDGEQWTDRVSAPYGAAQTESPGVPTNTPFVWILAALPVLSLISLAVSSVAPAVQNSLADDALSVVLYAAAIVLAYFDRKVLAARGISHPLHWAWTFLGSIVYMICRAVVSKRRTGRVGAGPLALFLVLIGLSFVAGVITVVVGVITALQNTSFS